MTERGRAGPVGPGSAADEPRGVSAVPHVVVGTDGSPEADRALRWAVREAELRLATLEVVHSYVVHARSALLPGDDRDRAEALLDDVVERNRTDLDRVKWSATTTGVVSVPSVGLVDAAFEASLIVVGAHGSDGFRRLRLGSTGFRTAAHAPAPVAVVPSAGQGPDLDARRPVVVGIDESPGARRALAWAVGEAARRGVDLTVVHVHVPLGDASTAIVRSTARRRRSEARARDAATGLVDRMLAAVDVPDDLEIDRIVVGGAPADLLLRHATADHLLVVGTRGRNAIGRAVFGSVSHRCVHHSTGPLVVVP